MLTVCSHPSSIANSGPFFSSLTLIIKYLKAYENRNDHIGHPDDGSLALNNLYDPRQSPVSNSERNALSMVLADLLQLSNFFCLPFPRQLSIISRNSVSVIILKV